MGTNRRRKVQKMRVTLIFEQKMHLLWGWCLDVDCKEDGFRSPGFPFRDEEHRRDLWFKNRDSLMAHMGREDNIEELGFPPGHRPYSWWQYEATQPRRQLKGRKIEHLTTWPYKTPEPLGNSCYYFGLPNFVKEHYEQDLFETQPGYLERLGLLTDTERKALSG